MSTVKTIALSAALATTALAASAVALPAAAQGWSNPQTYLSDSYVQVNGGGVFQGRTKAYASGAGLGSGAGSLAMQSNAFGSALIGHNITPAIAVELEGIYAYNDLDTGQLNRSLGTNFGASAKTYGGFANAKLRIPYSYKFRRFAVTPYIAGGIGYGNIEYRASEGLEAEHSGFMWQGKAGLEINTGTPVSFDLGYRYVETPEYTTPGAFYSANESALIKSHFQAATAGIRYTF